MSVISTAFALFVNNPHQVRRHITTRSITTTIQKTLYHSSNINNNKYDGQQRNNGILTSLFSSPPSKEEIDPGVVEGTDLRIVKYPHPCLRAKNDEVTLPDEQESISKLGKEMLKVMYAAEGVGLAAPQVGVNKRLMVYNPTGDSKKWLEEKIYVNPQIVEFSEAKGEDIEGCLSFPQMNGEVIRSKWIKVEAMTPRGKKVKKKFTGWEAVIFQHEYDHLDSVVYIDRLADETREKVQPRLNELIEEYDGDDGAI